MLLSVQLVSERTNDYSQLISGLTEGSKLVLRRERSNGRNAI